MNSVLLFDQSSHWDCIECSPLKSLQFFHLIETFLMSFTKFSILWRSSFLSWWPSSSAEVRVVVIHDIKEVEGEKQQEMQEDKRDAEIGDEVNGEVEEATQHAHETWRWLRDGQGTNLSHSVCTTIKEDSHTNWQQKRGYENEGSTMHDDSCIGINYAHAHTFSKCFRSFNTLFGFALCFVSSNEFLSP